MQIRIRVWKKSDPGYGINIPDPQHFKKKPAKLSLLAYPYFLSFSIALLWSVPPLPLSKGLPVPLVPQFPSFSSVEVLSISNF
jgi:hypothetical protein